MVIVAPEGSPVGSKPPAAGGERISKGWETRLGRRNAILDHDVIPASESGKFGHHAETSKSSACL